MGKSSSSPVLKLRLSEPTKPAFRADLRLNRSFTLFQFSLSNYPEARLKINALLQSIHEIEFGEGWACPR